MKSVKEESLKQHDQIVDIHAAVEELHGLSSREMSRLLRDSESFTLCLNIGKNPVQVDMDLLAGCLPLHLLAVLLSSDEGEVHFSHLLRGLRLLFSLSELASRHAKLEHILLEDERITEQILDLIFFMLLLLARYDQEVHGSFLIIQHAALVACSLHLLTAFVSPQWHDLVNVLLAHPKVNIFIEAAFDSVRKDIEFFQQKMWILHTKLQSKKTTLQNAERIAQITSQHCEASLQALNSLCQQKLFRERILENKELCENGGALLLALSILKLQVSGSFSESTYIIASISRMKSRVLSILIQLCETENFSFLDEVASSSKSMRLGTSVALEVLELLKTMLHKELKQTEGSDDNYPPKGHVFFNAMRLADILSDDSNFRGCVMNNITQDLADLSALPPGVFASSWCDVDLQVLEEDATLQYDPFRAAGSTMAYLKGNGSGSLELATTFTDESSGLCSLVGSNLPSVSFAPHRVALLVKIFANLHCYVPEICKEQEKNQFFNKFVKCLTMGPLNAGNKLFFWSEAQTAVRICENLCTLWNHSINLIPNLLNEEDMQLLSAFLVQLHDSICPSQPRNGSNQEEPMVEYLREKHEKKFKGMIQKHDHSDYWGNFSNLEPNSKNPFNTRISIDRNMEHNPSTPNVFQKDTQQISEEAQSTGGYRPSSKVKQEANEVDECIGPLEIKSEPEMHSRMTDEDRPSNIVDIQDVDQLRGRKDHSMSPLNTKHLDKRMEDINVISRSELHVDVTAHNSGGGGEPESNEKTLFMDKICLGKRLKNHDENGNVDAGKEDKNAGFVSQVSGKIESNNVDHRQPKKRRKTILNDEQLSMVDASVHEESERQWNAPSFDGWKDHEEPDHNSSRFSRWANNQKDRPVHASCEYETCSQKLDVWMSSSAFSNEPPTLTTSSHGSPESDTSDFFRCAIVSQKSLQPRRVSSPINPTLSTELNSMSEADYTNIYENLYEKANSRDIESFRRDSLEVGQTISLITNNGQEVGLGNILQIQGSWDSFLLDEQGLCVVEIKSLYVDRFAALPHPSDFSGNTFEEAEVLNGKMVVLWDINLILLPQNLQG